MKQGLRYLKKKDQFNYTNPDPKMLDLFKNPRVNRVDLTCDEVTSLCPITGQPDYHTITITYYPKDFCVESKSLKLYLNGFRMYGHFTETLARTIHDHLCERLNCDVAVTVESASRGGIQIRATALGGGMR